MKNDQVIQIYYVSHNVQFVRRVAKTTLEILGTFIDHIVYAYELLIQKSTRSRDM